MHEALDQFGDFGADHMGAKEFSGVGVEERLDHPLILAKRDRLPIGGERKSANAQFISGGAGLRFRQADAGDLRPAVGAGGNFLALQRMRASVP